MKKQLVLTSAAALLAAGTFAFAQQPAPQPGQLPPGHPGLNGRPQPTIIGPDGRPQGVAQVQGQIPPGRPIPGQGRPGFPQQGRPGFPQQPGRPGFPPNGHPPSRPGFPPPHHAAAHAEAEEEGGGEHECPGHGPTDPPPPPNLWHGILGVNNEKAMEAAQNNNVLGQLLWRYENPKDHCDARNEPPPYLASLINFGVLVLILYRFGRKPLADALAKRKSTITADIDTATKLKDDAATRLEQYEERLENIEAKLEDVRGEYAAQAEIEKKHILAEAEERRTRMRRDAELRVEQELKAARDELLREAVLAATAAAETLVQKQMSSSDHDRMAQDYLGTIGRALTVGGPS